MLGHIASRPSLGGPSANDYLINDSVFNRLLGTHEHVPIGIFLNFAQTLTRVFNEQIVEIFPQSQNFTRLDVKVSGLTLGSTQRLVNHDSRMRKGVTPSFVAGGQEQRSHARRLSQAQG